MSIGVETGLALQRRMYFLELEMVSFVTLYIMLEFRVIISFIRSIRWGEIMESDFTAILDVAGGFGTHHNSEISQVGDSKLEMLRRLRSPRQ